MGEARLEAQCPGAVKCPVTGVGGVGGQNVMQEIDLGQGSIVLLYCSVPSKV